MKNAEQKFILLLNQKPKHVLNLTDAMTLNIETYMQEGTGNGAKGVSRVTMINELG